MKIERQPHTKRDRLIRDGNEKIWPKVRPGMKVRCIIELGGPGIAGPREGEVYTVRELRRGLYKAWAVGFTLEEIRNKVEPLHGAEPFWSADAFELVAEDEPQQATETMDAKVLSLEDVLSRFGDRNPRG